MTDSSSFSSLLALVDSHLSKTSIQGSHSDDINNLGNRFPMPSLSGAQPGTLSDTRLQRLPIPSFGLSQSPIQNVLAEQVANMLKAKELKKQQEEEKKRLEEEMKKMKLEEEDDCIIDLMQALQVPYDPQPLVKQEVLSSSSSFESLFEPKFIDCDGTNEEPKSPEPVLPCIQDMSYILTKKIKRGKGSAFGKVMSSRLKPVAAPYFHTRIKTSIVPFDFSTPSPCDIIKEKLRRPTCCVSYKPDIINFVV
ncbi:uncharacterized protein LOC126380153 [Pectinophora gossypiella]|uniref:Uncharacterized protein n=1 Tax=Pectinophora gossypiella TaxID=13191 RepID=A0A1E1WH52_PECGO|nr:uncharacterized protein LOC126380153 [Pectinophora gossypiella]